MNKDDILEKSRQSNQDEGMQYAENQGRKIGAVAFTTLFAILAVLCLFSWQLNRHRLEAGGFGLAAKAA